MEAVADQFVKFYYSQFDSARDQLASLYRDHSMLTFEGSQTQGAAAITEKLKSLPFQQVKHQVDTKDVQPTGADGTSLVVQVTGKLLVDDSPAPLQFTQTFTLNPEGGSFYVFNDIFRLVYG
ncbi:nuclear transport factor 2 [Tilletiaria anomala UBC 951]|uniref:Nuclear transport factor 2 n=1 Tax=Tilletiaria anomala (strain ATCC 24038 / CBS 436.72 / UBC 951) TaxID=1037660 RepID=A0A066WL36_TILAU|nr:nuclear transport factor 2 [Tilletiaria anomala UBC 951]KDN53288.1 nuclear transport factor 2 [Tilletiaria anomala UBC 951]